MQVIDDSEMPEARELAAAGNLTGLYYYIHGLAERGSTDEAISFAESAHDQGRTAAQAYLADAVYSTSGTKPDHEQWRRLMTIDASAAGPESSESAYALGIDSMDRADRMEALRWLRRSGELGFQEAWVALGHLLLENDAARDPVEAVKCFIRCREGEPCSYSIEYPEDRWPVEEDGFWRDDELLTEIFAMATPEQAVAIRGLLAAHRSPAA